LKIENQITARIIKLPYQNFIQKQLSEATNLWDSGRREKAESKCSQNCWPNCLFPDRK